MKNLFFLLTVIGLLIISCGKETKEIVNEPDKILFSDLNTPLAKSTVRYYDIEDHGVCTVNIPIPSDSSASILLDINNDQEDDFIIKLSHNYWEPTEYCGHCSIYEYDIQIQGIHSFDLIAHDDQFFVKYFDYSDTISLNNSWINNTTLLMQGGCLRPIFNLENKFIGFKHHEQIGWIKVISIPNNGISIENYAIHLTNNKLITAGQTE